MITFSLEKRTQPASLSFRRNKTAFFVALFIVTVTIHKSSIVVVASEDNGHPYYGVDISYPIHHAAASTNFAWVENSNQSEPLQILGDRQSFYSVFLNGCRNSLGSQEGSKCDEMERHRIRQNLMQPPSMVNYTDLGFKKIRCPEKVFQLLKEFWEKNKDKRKVEGWGLGNTYTNSFEKPSYLVSVQDEDLDGGGQYLYDQIASAAQETIQEWTGRNLRSTSVYGIRIYEEGAILAPHVDRLPLISSAIVNVDQDLDEPWPLEVYGHDGMAHNVTMEPGDMVLYESHSVIHGRPFPLIGKFFANVFIHFEPVYEEGSEGMLPPYILEGSSEAEEWRRKLEQETNYVPSDSTDSDGGRTPAHLFASSNDLAKLRLLVKKNPEVLHAEDSNGWQPLHEAARAGHYGVVKFLLENNANINHRTNEGAGLTSLELAMDHLSPENPVIELLQDYGAEL
mmetsp:Transcript_20738/g.29567  ORF Transcript_20738/g.29567 Transcript_20738/m.29567 type:complete len:453 (+) Transcript_20738:31-1389(+)